MPIKSASGINATPNMYEGDRNADSAFDTVCTLHVGPYTVIAALKNEAQRLKNYKYCLILGLGDKNWILFYPLICLANDRVLTLLVICPQ